MKAFGCAVLVLLGACGGKGTATAPDLPLPSAAVATGSPEGLGALDAGAQVPGAGDPVASDETAAPPPEVTSLGSERCSSLREQFARRLAARTDRCAADTDCVCYPEVIVDCGGITDRATAVALGELADRYWAPPRCQAPRRCAPWRCEPVCRAGRCENSRPR